MGNWRRVHICGTIPVTYDLDEIYTYLNTSHDEIQYFVADGQGLCGINNWVSSHEVDVIGNIGKCDDSGMEDIVSAEMTHLLKRFPGISLTIHLGANYEEDECTATFKVSDGQCICGPPGCATIGKIENVRVAENCVVS
jgi:hypothetical protein